MTTPAPCRLIILFAALLLFSDARAEEVLRLSQVRDIQIEHYLTGGVLPLNQQPTTAALPETYDRQPNFGYIAPDQKAWLKFSVYNDTATRDWLLSLDSEAADYLDVYTVIPGDPVPVEVPQFKGGDQRPNDVRYYRFPGYYIPLQVAPGQQRDIYIAAYGRSTLALGIDLGHETEQIRKATNYLALDVLLISLSCAMLLFNLVMWRIDGEGFRLSYVLYLTGIITFSLYNSGLGYLYLWDNFPGVQQSIAYFGLALYFWGGYRFAQQFLRTRIHFPHLHPWVTVAGYLGALSIPFGLLNRLSEAVLIVTVANLVFFVVIIYLGIAATRKRLNSAPLFLVGWTGLVACSLTYNAYAQGLLPVNLFVQRAVIFGVAFESLLMSVAQANYLRNSQIDQQRSEKNAKEAAERALERRDEALSNAREANRSKDEFLRLVSHELRTPINHTQGMIEQLKETGLDEHQGALVRVLNQSTRLTHRQVENLLSYAELNAYRVVSRPRPHDIRRELTTLCDETRAAGNPNGHTLVVAGLDALPETLRVDWLQTRQILGHLLDNALRHTRAGDVHLEVTWTSSPPALVFHLSDPGPGIDASVLSTSNAFEVRSLEPGGGRGGLGLGIYLSRALAEVLDAELTIENRDGGTRVELVVPVSDVKAADAEDNGPHQPLKGARVLVVEDNLLNLKVLTAMLSREGCEWQTAYDGQSGVELANAQPFDLILMDCLMPVLDGFEATRLIRGGDGPNAATPILAVTANSMSKDRDQVFACGMDDLIPKPFSRQVLVERMHHWLRQTQLT